MGLPHQELTGLSADTTLVIHSGVASTLQWRCCYKSFIPALWCSVDITMTLMLQEFHSHLGRRPGEQLC
jgi:hypothetical protein